MNEIEKIKQLPSTKVEIEAFAEILNQGLDDGSINALELLKYFKAIEKLHENVKPMLDKMALQEASRYPESTIEAFGVKFTKKGGPPKWDYSNCNDSEYNLLKNYQNEYDKKVKDREKFLQTLTKPMELVDDDSGECIKIHPATKQQKDLVQVNFQ